MLDLALMQSSTCGAGALVEEGGTLACVAQGLTPGRGRRKE